MENATIWPQLIFIKSLTHSFALLVWDQDALNAKMASVCIALKCFADSSAVLFLASLFLASLFLASLFAPTESY